MFQGASALNLDTKSRLVIPAKYRSDLLPDTSRDIIVTAHPHGCLLLFPTTTWRTEREKIAQFPITAIGWKRILLGYASEQAIETNGRLLISPELRRFAQLEKEIMMFGQGSHFEIWNAAAWRQMELNTMTQGTPPGLDHFFL